MMRALVIAGCFAIHAGAVHAQVSPKTFECNYDRYSDGKSLAPVAGGFSMTFLIDVKADKAYVLGNNGASDVTLLTNQWGMTLVEITGTGNLMATVITFGGDSVHSRHTVFNGKIIPSQYYGRCVVR
jgi:hypothetical protein